MPKSWGHHCSAIGCKANRGACPKLSFFRFPNGKDALRSKRWVINLRRQDLKDVDPSHLHANNYVCANHFEPSQFMNSNNRNKLIWNAIPTVIDVPNPPKLLNLNSERAQRAKRRSQLEPRQPGKKKCVDAGSSTSSKNVFEVDNTVPDVEDNSSELRASSTLDKPSVSSDTNQQIEDSSSSRDYKLISESLSNKLGEAKKRIKLLNQKVCRLKRRLNEEKKKSSYETTSSNIPLPDEIIKYASHHLSGLQLSFVANQFKCAGSDKHARRWTNEDKQMASAWLTMSPKSYRFAERIFCLPSERSLRRWVEGGNSKSDQEQKQT